jgi:hypothetical protein
MSFCSTKLPSFACQRKDAKVPHSLVYVMKKNQVCCDEREKKDEDTAHERIVVSV